MNKNYEENIFLYQSIIKSYSNVNLDKIYNDVVSNKDNRLSLDPSSSRYEDSYCNCTEEIYNFVKEVKTLFYTITNQEISLEYLWGHVHEKNMSTRVHNHGDSFVSTVLYLSVPEGSGKIIFRPQTKKCLWKQNQILVPDEISYTPQKGMFLLFPGDLEHYVTRNLSSDLRVSLSLNFTLSY